MVERLTAYGATYRDVALEPYTGQNRFGCLFSTQRSVLLTDYGSPSAMAKGFAVTDLKTGRVVSRPR